MCLSGWGLVGHGFVYKVRLNLADEKAGPGPGVGYSERCKNRHCKRNIERQQVRVK